MDVVSDDSDDGMAVVDDELHLDLSTKKESGGNLPRDACPDDLVFVDQPFGVALHPSRDLVAVGLISGVVSVFSYTVEGKNGCVLDGLGKPVHQAGVRCVAFDSTGRHLYSTGTDMALVVQDVETGALVYRNPRIHLKAVSAMSAYVEGMLATGDEDGLVKLWDMRQQREASTFDEHEDWVSSFTYNELTRTLVSVAADGVLVAMNTRSSKVIGQSYTIDDEILSAQWMKGGKRIVAGTQEGIVAIWTNGQWDDPSDRFPGHPNSIDAIVKIDEDTIVTGSSDGLLRLISVEPNKLLGVVGEHSDFPVEALELSHDRKYLVSASHDNKIKFWNIEYLYDDGEEDEAVAQMDTGKDEVVPRDDNNDDDDDDVGDDDEGEDGNKLKKESKKSRKGAFFSGLN